MRLKLLIADDHELMLEASGWRLQMPRTSRSSAATSSGAQVLPLVRQTSPDVVLLDLRMPGMDGLRCLEALRERHPDVKAVVLSGSEEPDVIDAAFQRGAAAFIVKRIDPVDLAPVIRQVLDGNVFYPVEARPPAAEAVELGPDPARGGHPQGARRRALEQADRPPVLAVRADDQVPPDEHLPQARRGQQDGGRAPRLRARADREPAAPRDRPTSASRRSRRLPCRVGPERHLDAAAFFAARREGRSGSLPLLGGVDRRGMDDMAHTLVDSVGHASAGRQPLGKPRQRPAFSISTVTPKSMSILPNPCPQGPRGTSRIRRSDGWSRKPGGRARMWCDR